MGIKDLKTFLRQKKVECFYTVPLETFSGKRVGIDALNWVFCYMGNCVGSIVGFKKDIVTQTVTQEEIYETLVYEFLSFNIKFLKNNITPVWIWDGTSKSSKDETKKERREARKKISEKKDNIYEILKSSNPLERPWELVEEYKKLLKTTLCLSREKINNLRDFSEEIGLPTITAEEEGESLGASLAAARILAGFWSADTDIYPLGCPVAMKGFKYIDGVLNIECVFTPNILKGLNFNHKEFRDFCIMLGTDFNNRIPGIGPVKSYKLMSEHRTIENIEKEKNKDGEKMYDCGCLNFREVREQFYSYRTDYTGFNDLQLDKKVDIGKIKEKYNNIELITKFFSHAKYLCKSENVPK